MSSSPEAGAPKRRAAIQNWELELRHRDASSLGPFWRFTSPYGLFFRAIYSLGGFVVVVESPCCRGGFIPSFMRPSKRRLEEPVPADPATLLFCDVCDKLVAGTRRSGRSGTLERFLWNPGTVRLPNVEHRLEELLDPLTAAYELSTVVALLEALTVAHQGRWGRWRRFKPLMAEVLAQGPQIQSSPLRDGDHRG